MKRGILFALVLLLCGGIACAPRKTRYSETRYDLFDTVTVLTGYAESEAAFSETANRVFEELAAYHALFDIYHDAERNNLKTVNDCAGGDPVPVDPAIIDLLLLGREVDALTGHRVNITLGAVLALWHDARTEALEHPESAEPPSGDALRDAARHTGFDLLLIDEAAGTVRLTDPRARLDVGAIAKGYAAQRVSENLPEGYLLSVGGNVVAKGTKPDGALWSVGIQDPDDAAALLLTVTASDLAIVTSGDYQRVFTADGVRYHHIIDPETNYPAVRWRSVTVLCADSAAADALSTALFLMEREDGEALLKQFGADALWVAPGGERFMTEGFRERIKG